MSQLFRALEELLGTALATFYDWIPSFGVSIILLTIVINLILFPLTLKQTRATRAFQAIQPEIKRIQQEFKEDQETMQKELMRVQREAGANPLGCVGPLILQAPIWFALFRVLSAIGATSNGEGTDSFLPESSSLLRDVRAGEIGFLGMDLGQFMSDAITGGVVVAIPYVIMLVLMVAVQYFQQWHATAGAIPDRANMTPQQRQAQRSQQMITRVMPLFIGFISWNFPAGLVLYWTTSNLFRLGQQFVIFAIDGRPTPPGPSANGSGPSKSAPEPVDGDDSASEKKPQPRAAKNQRRRRK